MKLTTKVDKNSSARTQDDQRTIDEEMHVRPAIGNTSVTGRRKICEVLFN